MKRKFQLILFLFLLVTACRKDRQVDAPEVEAEQDSPSLTIAEAKTWLGSQKDTSKISLQSTQKSFGLTRLNIAWEKVQSVKTDTPNYLLAHLPGQPIFQNNRQGYRKLVFKRGTGGAIEALILEVIPDALYIQRARTVNPATFTGRVFIYDRNYRLKSGSLFINGKRAGAIRPQSNTKSAPSRVRLDLVQVVENCTWVDNNYINANGEVVIYSERICTYDITDSGDMAGGGSSGPVYTGSGGGGGGTSASSPPISNLPGETKPAINPKSYVNCFRNIPDAGAKMKVTVYVQEPWPGTTFNLGPNSVGHVAIGLTKSNGTQTITQVVGFYPNATGLNKINAPSKLVDNGGFDYNASITYNVDSKNFTAILNYIGNPPTTYDLTNFNCTDFAISACKTGGITLPNATNTVGLSGPGGAMTAMTPAGLGDSIEKLNGNNVNKNGGTMPASKGACK